MAEYEPRQHANPDARPLERLATRTPLKGLCRNACSARHHQVEKVSVRALLGHGKTGGVFTPSVDMPHDEHGGTYLVRTATVAAS